MFEKNKQDKWEKLLSTFHSFHQTLRSDIHYLQMDRDSLNNRLEAVEKHLGLWNCPTCGKGEK